jgi:capsular exopolysaccharide synthesis family protein
MVVDPSAPPPPERPRSQAPLKMELPLLDAFAGSAEALFDTFTPTRGGFSGAKTVTVNLDRKQPLIPNASSDVIVERYRRLRTKILQQHATKPINSLLVASPGAGDGKTITVLNLAVSFGMLPSFKVLVVDGDLRKRAIAGALGVEGYPGLSNLLDGSARRDDVILRAEGLPFQFMLGGTSTVSAAELLGSPKLQTSIRQLTQHFDLILVDSPPVNLMADAQMLAGGCDGVLLVARAFTTTGKAFERTLQDLLPFRLVGTVLNGAAGRERQGYEYKGHSRTDG